MPNPGGTKKNLVPMQSVWRHQPTKTIRVPEVLVDKILEYAHKLDKEIPEQRIEINDGWVIVHSPCDPKGHFQDKARSIQGWRFHRRTCSWWYPLVKLEEVVVTFPDCSLHDNVLEVLASSELGQ
ncbi:hypothetical protein RIVM261_002150 [Rivularia sp. IAM M-261]|nr:hypothetical protein CAL7716_054900 [Calothrix sp. PCC 7716]GJD15259.1 hypothetical protein RIVM261_002150 [Rivularia sp. IAM M-261]